MVAAEFSASRGNLERIAARLSTDEYTILDRMVRRNILLRMVISR
jgi:hypothetical protein